MNNELKVSQIKTYQKTKYIIRQVVMNTKNKNNGKKET